MVLLWFLYAQEMAKGMWRLYSNEKEVERLKVACGEDVILKVNKVAVSPETARTTGGDAISGDEVDDKRNKLL